MRATNAQTAAKSVRGLLFLGALTLATCYLDENGHEVFRLHLLHTNDMHSHFKQFDKVGKFCSEYDTACFGGFPRLKTAVIQEKDKANNDTKVSGTLFVNAGDTFTGTAFYSFFKWEIVAKLLPDLKIDVMSLGNHEFDDGIEELDKYIGEIDIPIVACNVDLSNVSPALVNGKKILKSKVLEVKGRKIGIIGYVTRETPTLSNPGNVKFLNEIASIQDEANRLKNDGIKIIIAVGHSGFEIDEKIAREVKEIDVVVGGHSDTFLYSGTPPHVEMPEGPYPFCVTQPETKRQVPIVQAFHVTKYLGQLWVDFDENGEVLGSFGNPILMDSSIPQDSDLLNKVNEFQDSLDQEARHVVGQTNVFLDGKACKLRECNFGNFITDAFIDYYIHHSSSSIVDETPPIALQQSGGIRNDIDNVINSGNITYQQLMTALPFRNKLGKIQMKGSDILEAIKRGFKHFDGKNPHGEFMQVAGLKFEMDFSLPKDSRLTSIKVRRSIESNKEDVYDDLVPDTIYSVLINEYMWEGGGGFRLMTKLSEFESLGISDFQIIKERLENNSPILPAVNRRITLLNIEKIVKKKDDPNSTNIDENPIYSAVTCGSITNN